MGTKRGQPKTSLFVQRSIASKVVQYVHRYKLTVRQAWLKLSEVNPETSKFKKRGMEELINEHYNNKTAKDHWVNELKNKSNRIQFYKNHLKKWVDEYLDFKEEQLRRRTSGIASIFKLPKRPRKH
jgi:hypothetical protein